MKKIFSLFIIITVYQSVVAQSPRRCGCKTWKEWKAELPPSDESRSDKKKQYSAYIDGCLKTCREKNVKKTEALSRN